MLKIPQRGPSPELEASWHRVVHYANALFRAIDELDELGGTCAMAAQARWSAEACDRALGMLQCVVEAADAEVNQLQLRRRHLPRARRLG